MHVALVQIPNFNSLTVVSLLAALMSLSYSTIAIGASIAAGRQADAYYNLDTKSTSDAVFGEETPLQVCLVQSDVVLPAAPYWTCAWRIPSTVTNALQLVVALAVLPCW